jgi:DNA repair exonuclease SbcCD ATPase subunit
MANQVEIFNIDFGDTLNSIEKLKAELKETRKLFETAKPNTAEFVKYSTEVKRLDGTIKALNGVTKENQNALGGINNAAKFASGSYGELKQKIEQQKKALLELNIESEDFVNTQEELIKLQEQRIEIEKKIPSLFQERIKGAIDESNSLKQLRLDLKAAQSAALNGDGKAAERVAELKDKIDDLKDSTQSLQGSGVERLNTSIGLLTEGFANFDTDKVKTGFKGIGAAMSAIPIVLLIEGVKLLIDNFDKVKEVVQNLIPSLKEQFNLTKELNTANVEAAKNAIVERNNLDNLYKASTDQTKSIDERKKAQIELQKTYPLTFKNFSDEDFALGKAKKGYDELSKSILDASMLKAKQSLLDKEAIAFAEAEQQRLNEIAEAREKLATASKKQNVAIDIESKTRQVLASDYDAQLSVINELIRENEAEAESFKKKNATILGDLAKYQQGSDKIEAERAAAAKESKKSEEDAAKEAAEARKKRAEERRKLEIEQYKDSIKIRDELIKEIEDKEAAANAIRIAQEKEATAIMVGLIQEIEDKEKQGYIDRVALAEAHLIDVQRNGTTYLEAQLGLLNAEREQELSNTELTQAQRAEITAKYREQELQLNNKYYSDNLQAASNVSASLGDLSNSLFDLKRSNLQKGSEEDKIAARKQFDVNKAFGITTALIQGAVAVINASASVPYLPVGLAASIAATATTAATVAKISSTKFQYFDGGYTEQGNPREESYSMGNKQFHKSEYVIPAKVLSTPTGSLLASKAESMRKGFKPSGISGYFDGGFTNNSVSRSASTANNFTSELSSVISKMQVVARISEINRVSKQNEVGVNISSL